MHGIIKKKTACLMELESLLDRAKKGGLLESRLPKFEANTNGELSRKMAKNWGRIRLPALVIKPKEGGLLEKLTQK